MVDPSSRGCNGSLSQFPSTDASTHSDDNVVPVPPPGPDPHCRPPAKPPPLPLNTDSCNITPQGSIFDTITQSPFHTSTTLADLSDLTVNQATFNAYTPPRGSVIHIRCRPRIFGLRRDSASAVVAKLIDGGANICVTGDLSTLVNVEEISPMPISVAIAGDDMSSDDRCTKRGYTPLTLDDGTLYWQLCYYCANVVETIISPQAVIATSDVFTSWTQTGYKDGCPGSIRFDSADSFLSMSLHLEYVDGLDYCTSDTYTIDLGSQLRVNRIAQPPPTSHLRQPSRYRPTTKSKQLESELWLLRLGSPGVYQLDHLPGNATGLPTEFDYHPFRFIDFKEQAKIRKQAVQRSAI